MNKAERALMIEIGRSLRLVLSYISSEYKDGSDARSLIEDRRGDLNDAIADVRKHQAVRGGA